MSVLTLLLTWGALSLTGCSGATEPPDEEPENGEPEPVHLAVVVVAEGLSSPLYLTAPPGDARLFVVEQAGRVRIIKDGKLLVNPFLDIRERVGSGGERGLLSVAFDPDYATNGHFFASYTDRNGDTRIERYTVTADPNVADPVTARLVLTVDQPFGNHNGGLIAFGPDGMLYVGLGDGGGGGDPLRAGQDLGTLLGKLLRIDVRGSLPYEIPADNPFVEGIGARRPEIWAYGLRNPWRFSFDREAGRLYIADVGQNRWEEVNAVAADAAGLNYGWNAMEGAHCFATQNCDTAGLVLPAVEYGHSDGCSVTGGYVYRGSLIPEVLGHYFYSDYCTGFLRSFRYDGAAASDEREWDVGDLGNVLSFGEDSEGELYILSGNGRVYRLIAVLGPRPEP